MSRMNTEFRIVAVPPRRNNRGKCMRKRYTEGLRLSIKYGLP